MTTFTKRLVVAITLGLLLMLALAPSEGAHAASSIPTSGHRYGSITPGALNAYGSHWDGTAPDSGNYPPIELAPVPQPTVVHAGSVKPFAGGGGGGSYIYNIGGPYLAYLSCHGTGSSMTADLQWYGHFSTIGSVPVTFRWWDRFGQTIQQWTTTYAAGQTYNQYSSIVNEPATNAPIYAQFWDNAGHSSAVVEIWNGVSCVA